MRNISPIVELLTELDKAPKGVVAAVANGVTKLLHGDVEGAHCSFHEAGRRNILSLKAKERLRARECLKY